MLDVQQALEAILADNPAAAGQPVPLADALGLVLANDIASDIDSPPHDKSMVDGYAVKQLDLAAGPVVLTVNEEVTAGQVPTLPVQAGTASRIMTGAPVPEGTEAVVMIERTQLVEGAGVEQVRIDSQPLSEGANVMPQGSSLQAGQVILSAGRQLRPIEIGLLAEVGHDPVAAIVPPEVAILPTGNELVAASEVPAAGQIRNSNGPLLEAQLRRCGAKPLQLGICGDDDAMLDKLIATGLSADILLLSGGVSAGVLDLVPAALARQQVQEVFHRVKIKPGKPVWYGRCHEQGRNCHVFGLPGNPVSSLVCFEVFVRPLIDQLAGRKSSGLVRTEARLTDSFLQRGDRPSYHPSYCQLGSNGLEVQPLDWLGSADQKTLTAANCLACFPAGECEYDAGSQLQVLLLETPPFAVPGL